MKCNSNVLNVKRVARAHKSKDKPQHALLILRKLAKEDKGTQNKSHLKEFLYVLNDRASFQWAFLNTPQYSFHRHKKTKHKAN